MSEKIELIRIHTDGRTTDYGLVNYYSDLYPLGFYQAQVLLKAVEKFIKRKGFFTNDEKRFLKVQTELSGMFHAISREGFGTENPLAGFAQFMNMISDTFPNWQPEYTALNDIFLAPAIEEQGGGESIAFEYDEDTDDNYEEDESPFIDGFDGNVLMDWMLFSKKMSNLTKILADDMVQYVSDRSGSHFSDEYHIMDSGAVSLMTGFLWILSDSEQEEKIRHINIYRDASMALLKNNNGWNDDQAAYVLRKSDGFTRFLMDDIACFNTMSDSSLQDLVRSQIRMLYCECKGINYHDAMFNLNLLPESDADLRHTLFAMGMYGQVRNEISPIMKKML